MLRVNGIGAKALQAVASERRVKKRHSRERKDTAMIMLDRLDHLVLTVADIEATTTFYRDVLGCEVVTFGKGRTALEFGQQKINLHQAGREFEPKANRPMPGSADLCLILATPLDAAIEALEAAGVPIVEGPVDRTGAMGPIRSVYIRDPDQNLIELSCYEDA